MGRDKRESRMVHNSLVLVFQLSLSMVTPIMLCLAVSYFIARIINNRNVIIFGIIIGIIAGINGVYRQVKVYTKKIESPGERARRLEREMLDANKMDETP